MKTFRIHGKLCSILVLCSCAVFLHGTGAVKDHLKLEDISVHDPWILADLPCHCYYLYTGAGSHLGTEPSGVVTYKSEDLKFWSGPYDVFHVSSNSWANPTQGVWAPEVHTYNGKYYLFATLNNYDKEIPPMGNQEIQSSGRTRIQVTYAGASPHLRGTQVFVANSPEGPFKSIIDQPIPPADYMSLDGTFYLEDGIPYMIYAHEWTQLVDGTMEAVQMKPDLSASVGRPFYLFKASDAPWLDDRHETTNVPQGYVTDGPEMYRTSAGKLLMIWSSYRQGSYVEALAHSTSGKLAGPWKQDGVLADDDSGHGMLFHTFDGRLMLILTHPFDPHLSRGKVYEMEDTGDSIRIKK